MNTWEDDLLGAGYLQMTIPLDPDDEGDVVTTLVKYIPELDPNGPDRTPEPTFVFLALHGWNDYFFHPHVADFWEEHGFAFYALDLRRYGSCKHAGYGLGFERLVMYLTGVGNIRDVLPHPRTVGNADF